jgi:hypothetical protein
MSPRNYRVPPDITGPYATRIGPKGGHWRSHPTNDAAWQYVAKKRAAGVATNGSLVLRVTSPGHGEPAPEPDGRPYGWASGAHVTDRARVPIRDGWRDAAAAEGVPLSQWIADAADAWFRSRKSAR